MADWTGMKKKQELNIHSFIQHLRGFFYWTILNSSFKMPTSKIKPFSTINLIN